MRGKNLNILKTLFAALLILGTAAHALAASDLPLAAGSPLAGISFDDRPLLLPVQRNFQMAMLTASSEIGRSCGKMESYGWRMSQLEQQRVNLIFNNTVDRLRAAGYVVESEAPRSVSRDVTLFTADRPDRHFIFMWSAGEIGLVMVLCESSATLRATPNMKHTTQVETFPTTRDVLQSKLDTPVQPRNSKTITAAGHFSPVGDWVGDYTCMQGVTGATLKITSMHGEDFQGEFRFYPTPKNRYVAKGSYMVSGQYDAQSHRILVNPGKWIDRPKNYYNTIIVGSFDPASRTFSGFFQGIMGCTSFEARYSGNGLASEYKELGSKAAAQKAAAKKKAKKKKAPKPAATDAATAPANPPGIPPVSDGIKLPDNSAAPATAPTPVAPPVAAPAPAPAAPAAAAPVPVAPPVAAPPAPPAAAPMPVPASPPAPKPTSMNEDKKGWIVLALNQYNTNVPQLPLAPTYNTSVPQISAAPHYNTNVPQIAQASTWPLPSHAPPPNYVAPSVPEANLITPQIGQAPQAPGPSYYNTNVPQIAQASRWPSQPEIYTDP